MARDHIEFFHTQQLAWEQELLSAFPGVQGKTLSVDRESGARSVLLRFPPGWAQPAPQQFPAGQELYVLDGAIEINDRHYGLDCYAHLPAGTVRHAASTPSGCDMIAFFDREPASPAAGAPAREAGPPAVPYLNAHEMAWECEGMDPFYADWGLKWKILLHDPDTSATTMLVSMPPQVHPANWQGPREIHDCMEEAFMLAGDLYTHNGVFHQGMYFYRPPRIHHGPFASRFGCLILVRVDGVLENNWTQDEMAVTFDPTHAPVLPPGLAAAAGQAWHPGRRY